MCGILQKIPKFNDVDDAPWRYFQENETSDLPVVSLAICPCHAQCGDNASPFSTLTKMSMMQICSPSMALN